MPVDVGPREAAPLCQVLRGSAPPRRILLPRFDTHGDIVLLKGFVDALLARLPSAEITLLVREGYDELAGLFSARLAWRTLACDARARYSDEELPPIAEMLRALAAEPWDLVLFTTYNRTFLDDLLAAALEAPPCIALGQPPVHSPWRRHVLGRLGLPSENPYTNIVPVGEHLHETEKYRLMWRSLWGNEGGVGLPMIEVPAPFRLAADDLLAGLGLRGRPYAVCMPAGVKNVAFKTWPREFFAETLVWLARTRQWAPLVIGHESERELVEAVSALTQARGLPAQTWLGRTGDMGLLAALLDGASLYLGNDSAPMHLAAAVGVPTLGIFGGGTWPRFTAMGTQCLSVAAEVPCCYCRWDCPFGEAHCLRAIEPHAVRSGIGQLLDEVPAEARILFVPPSLPPVALELMGRAAARHRSLTSELEQRQDVIDELALAYEAVSAANGRVAGEIDSLRGAPLWKRWLGIGTKAGEGPPAGSAEHLPDPGKAP